MASSFDQVVEVLEAIKRNDATPRYEYGEPRPDSEKPPGGTRWSCPRELADDALGLLKLVEERPEVGETVDLYETGRDRVLRYRGILWVPKRDQPEGEPSEEAVEAVEQFRMQRVWGLTTAAVLQCALDSGYFAAIDNPSGPRQENTP